MLQSVRNLSSSHIQRADGHIFARDPTLRLFPDRKHLPHVCLLRDVARNIRDLRGGASSNLLEACHSKRALESNRCQSESLTKYEMDGPPQHSFLHSDNTLHDVHTVDSPALQQEFGKSLRVTGMSSYIKVTRPRNSPYYQQTLDSKR